MALQQSNKRIAKNTIFLYLRMLLVLFVSIYTTRVVLNVLGVVDYGIYNVVAGFVSLFAFINATMVNGIQRFYNFEIGIRSSDNQNQTYSTAIQIQLGVALILLLLLETIGLWYINNIMVIPVERLNAANWVFQCSVISLIFVVAQIPFSALIMAKEKFDYYAAISIFDVAFRLAIVISLKYIAYDRLIIYGFLSLGISVIDFLLYWIYCHIKFSNYHFYFKFYKEKFKTMLSFCGWNILDTFAYTVKGQGLNILLNAFFGPVVNAARAISSQIMGAIQGFSMNIVMAFRPQLVESYAAGNYQRVTKLMYITSNASYILLYTLSVPIVIEIKYILKLWLGNDVPEYTIPFTILVLVNMVISSLNTPLSQVVQAVGKLKYYQIFRSIIISSILPASWLALKIGFSPVSVFYVSLAFTILNQPVSMVLLHRIYNYSYREYNKAVTYRCLAFSILMPLIPLLISNVLTVGFIRLIITCISACISAIICGYFIATSNERTLIKTYIQNKINGNFLSH